MKKKFRSILALAMALAMVLALTACGSSSTDADTVEEDASVTSEEDEGVVVYDIDASTSYVEDYGEDTSADYEEETIELVEVAAGDVLYSDDNCSVTLASVETNDDGGTTVTLSVVNNYEGSLTVGVVAYGEDQIESVLDGSHSGKVEGYDSYTVEGETEADWAYEFSSEYIYFDIDVAVFSEFLTQEQIEGNEYLGEAEGLLFDTVFLVNTAE
ncbi:MAG: hypothetical protein LUG17_00635 [Clostridiales bacterium]|nr:hypothetical protein [Clostridiales bacterium]